MAAVENLTIMFTDIVGFSDMVANLPRKVSRNILEIHDRVLVRVIRRFGGRIVKSIGDSFLATFRSPTDAVLCGMAMHDALWEEYQRSDNPHSVAIRVSLNAGEVRQTSHDVFGDAVNIAARLEEITPANAVYLTEAVYLAMNRSEMELEKIGSLKFRNIPDEITIYQAHHNPNDIELPLVADKEAYPYGGAHVHLLPAHKPASPLIRPLFLSALLFAVFPLWWAVSSAPESTMSFAMSAVSAGQYSEEVLLPVAEADEVIVAEQSQNEDADPTDQLRALALPLLESKDYLGLERRIADWRQRYADNAYLQLLSAHVDVYFKRNISALTNYHLAFDAEPELAKEPLAVENMMTLMEREGDAAGNLIARHLNEQLIDKLAKRTGEPGLAGRYDAFFLLKDTGHADAIDRVGINIQDLRELDECQLKKVAVEELKRLKDPRALDALNAVLGTGPLSIFRNRCLRKEAREAIALIEESQLPQ